MRRTSKFVKKRGESGRVWLAYEQLLRLRLPVRKAAGKDHHNVDISLMLPSNKTSNNNVFNHHFSAGSIYLGEVLVIVQINVFLNLSSNDCHK